MQGIDKYHHMRITPWRQRWHSVLSKITVLQTEGTLQSQVLTLSQPATPTVLAFVNAYAMNSCAERADFYDALMGADVLFRDGSGMATLYRMLGMSPGLNLNGTDLIPKVIQACNGKTIALYGTQQPYLDKGKAHINAHLAPSSTVYTAHGFLPPAEYVQLALQQQPALIVLGMGMPKQELLAAQLRQQLSHPCLVVCGGAIIDFMGGKVSRAPAWMRASGLEWLYRLMREPVRLFKRYVIGNPVFLVRAKLLSQQHPPV